MQAFQRLVQEQWDSRQEGRVSEGIEALLWQPDPRNQPQCLAYELAKSGAVMEIGYGGEAGGGKTELALGIAATLFKRSRIMRREFPQLNGIIARGDQLYPTSFVGGIKKSWQFGDRTIMLGSMQHDKDWRKYQGQPIEFLAPDEAAEFTETGIRLLTGWLRSGEGRKTLILYPFNPPTMPEGQWIIDYFAPWIDPAYPNPAESGEIRWMAHLPQEGTQEKAIEVPDGTPFEHEGVLVYPISRTFVRATRRDNPYLGMEYERRLQALPEPMRTMFRDGDFTVGAVDDAWQVIPTNRVLEAQERWRNTPKPDVALRAIGNDVAHGGADQTVISRLFGVWFDELLIYPGEMTPNGDTTAKYVQDVWDGQAPIGVDATGYGASASDTMLNWGMKPTPVNFGAGSDILDKSKKFKFFNLRAQMYFELAYALDPASGENICLPPSRTLRVDLCAPRYKVVTGKIQLEEKKDIKKRLNRSPDEGDAVVLAWYVARYGWSREAMDRIANNEVNLSGLSPDLLRFLEASGVDTTKMTGRSD